MIREDQELHICTWGHHETDQAVKEIVVVDDSLEEEVEYDICEDCYHEMREN